MEIDAH